MRKSQQKHMKVLRGREAPPLAAAARTERATAIFSYRFSAPSLLPLTRSPIKKHQKYANKRTSYRDNSGNISAAARALRN